MFHFDEARQRRKPYGSPKNGNWDFYLRCRQNFRKNPISVVNVKAAKLGIVFQGTVLQKRSTLIVKVGQ